MADNNILVIGNGFDLYHGLNTRYIDFVEYLNNHKNESFSKNSFVKYFIQIHNIKTSDDVTWIDCENEINKIISFFQGITDKKEIIQKKKGVLEEDKFEFSGENKIIANAFEKYICFEPDTYKIESEYLKSYSKNTGAPYEEEKILDKNKVINDLVNELVEIIKILEEYLKTQERKQIVDKFCSQLSTKEFSYVINFNYTHTYQLYKIDDAKVYFVHGETNSNPNNMVLGFEDDGLGGDYIWFQKYFQRIQKHIKTIDSSKFNMLIAYNDKCEKIQEVSRIDESRTVTHIFGYSLGCSDGDMITKIVDMSDKVIIYWCDQRDYDMKLMNLFEVLRKERVLNMIENQKIVFEKII